MSHEDDATIRILKARVVELERDRNKYFVSSRHNEQAAGEWAATCHGVEAEVRDLRSKLAEVEKERDAALKGDEVGSIMLGDQADLIRTLVDALKLERGMCPDCGGDGVVDSGGVTPWGAGIDRECPGCSNIREALDAARKAGVE